MAKKLNPVNVRLDDEMREELKKIAQAENRTLSNLIVTVLREYLERRTKAPRS
jgi:predicted transcriptional regulator